MKSLKVLLLAMLFVAPACSPTPRTSNQSSALSNIQSTARAEAERLCFVGWTNVEFIDHLEIIADYLRTDDFFSLGKYAEDRVTCDKELSFVYYWSIYTNVSAKLNNMMIGRPTAEQSFMLGWKQS